MNTLLEQALALPAGELDAWLAALPTDQQADVPLLRSMLARASVESDSFMRRPLPLEALPTPDDDQAGQMVGPYRLLERLGEGGMAVVWLAEREDGIPRRQVALKLPRPGWGTGLAQRIVHERDILASLEHDDIACLYDAGMTAEGRPWLAMKRVQGEPIDQYCRSRAMPVRARVELFARVADAVAYAHSRLVVHRDLKPSNILVTPEGEVRLLDFGVAKLLEGDAPGADHTHATARAVTPDYAAPEQVGGHAVSAATDVYSLGVVMYELLCGERPYRMGLRTGTELERAIVQAPVMRPSQRVRGDRRLARELRGDLDIVVGKAMRHQPDDRYPSMESLAADLRRYLAGEPVLAQPPSRSYRARKFVLRHRFGLAAAAGIGLALVAGLGLALWQAQEARRQAGLAIAGLERADAAIEFASAVLMEGLGRDERLSLPELLDRAVGVAERSFDGNPVERGVSALAVAEWLARSGRRADALGVLERTIASLPERGDATMLTDLRCHHAYQVARIGRQAEGAAELDRALASAPADLDNEVRAFCEHRRGVVASELGDRAGELRYMQRAAQSLAQAPQASRTVHAHVLADLGGALWSNGHMRDGEQAFQQAFALLGSVGRRSSQAALSARHNFAIELLASGQPLRALDIFREVEAAERRQTPSGHPALEVLAASAEALLCLWRDDEAAVAFAELAEGAQHDGDAGHLLRALTGQARARWRQGRTAEAEALYAQASAMLQSPGMDVATRSLFTARLRMAERLQLAGLWRAADQAYEQLATGPGTLTPERRAEVQLARAEIALAEQRADAARALVESALAASRERQGDLPFSQRTGRALLTLAQVEQARGNRVAARTAALQAAAHIAATARAEHPQAVQARQLAAALGG
ncbi:MAG: protein kinase [Proteobacteria bacterium]|nr:protein kinase [Pseudomonadota bacterium]